MPISYKLYRNHFNNGAEEKYSARVEYLDTLYEDDIINEMLFHDSSLTRATIAAVDDSRKAAIIRLGLKGFRVYADLIHYGLAIKGNFTSMSDSFDPSRHRVEPQVSMSTELREALTNKIPVEKELALIRQPMPVQFSCLSDTPSPNTLTPGGMGKLVGKQLRYDPADPKQGVFLIAPDASERRLRTDGVIMPGSLIFLIPADLTPGDYRLEVRRLFGNNELSIGRLKTVLTVPA